MKPRMYSPRDAVSLARKLGWTAEPKNRTGDFVFVTPTGERFTSKAPGRCDRVPIVLAKALTEHASKAGLL